MSKRIDQPREGFYTVRLVRGALAVPVRIWWGQPIIGGEVQDRSPRWCVEVDGRTDRLDRDERTGDPIGRVPLDVHDVWPFCTEISEAEYRFLQRRLAWAREQAPHHPAANPRTPIDLRTLPPGF